MWVYFLFFHFREWLVFHCSINISSTEQMWLTSLTVRVPSHSGTNAKLAFRTLTVPLIKILRSRSEHLWKLISKKPTRIMICKDLRNQIDFSMSKILIMNVLYTEFFGYSNAYFVFIISMTQTVKVHTTFQMQSDVWRQVFRQEFLYCLVLANFVEIAICFN